MIRFLLFSVFLLGTSYATAQTFVDDVDKVEIVVIDYCVDANGERYEIKINTEKTTYLDEEWQLGSLEAFKNSEMNYPMKMINECWTAVYYFVNTVYKTAEIPEFNREKCKMFRAGIYKYENTVYSNTKIVRKEQRQFEDNKDKNELHVYEINWVDHHIYTLKGLVLPLEKDKHRLGDIILVEIVHILNENSYLYKAHYEESDNINYGIITKVSELE